MQKTLSFVAGALAALVVLRALPLYWGHRAEALYDGERAAQEALARGVDHWVDADLGRGDFSTGSSRFDGEWLFATRMMAVLGYAQVAMEHPELATAHEARIDACLDALVTEEARAFDREAWGHDPLEDLGTERAHVAYLGYLAIAIAAAEVIHPHTPHAPLLRRIVEHLVPLFEASPTGLLETYPGEAYPIDNTAFLGALGLFDRVHEREDHGALLARAAMLLRTRFVDRRSGLLVQSVAPEDGAVVDGPRGSGTALAAYYLSFADPALSRELYDAIRARLARRTLGFGTTREYVDDGEGGWGDVDSGPVILGQGVSATGFTLALARLHGDRETYVATWATAEAIGGAVDGSEGTHFALGGPVGDALLFALATAQPLSRVSAPGRPAPGWEAP